ncbi:hypothetical protein OG373_38530 [Streptomyces avidinii]|uniref:hypothetical protein n=1 Tax=Streptomyces avidinii TaxID=1895 RepID=UPI0038646C3B|nr:hypothetical protein OG373_38530 [Streptomyces avidinii]
MIYWFARPSEHQPTIEFRVTDSNADLDTTAHRCAARYGAAGFALDPFTGDRVPAQALVGTAGPGLRAAGDEAEVDRLLDGPDRKGTGRTAGVPPSSASAGCGTWSASWPTWPSAAVRPVEEY